MRCRECRVHLRVQGVPGPFKQILSGDSFYDLPRMGSEQVRVLGL